MRAWRRAGVDVVVSLLEPGEAADLELADETTHSEANGIEFHSFPIPETEEQKLWLQSFAASLAPKH
jgi:hypothetical protein